MPPSGYNPDQTGHLACFLKACADALLEEAAKKQIPLGAALDAEISNINHHLDTASSSAAQHATLELTRAFYENIRACAPKDTAAFLIAASEATIHLETDILKLKVSEIA